jgi:hypothetical protein
MTRGTTIIQTSSGGNLRIDTPDGQYTFSPGECQQLLLFNKRIILRHEGRTSTNDSETVVYLYRTGTFRKPSQVKTEVVIKTARHCYSLPDYTFADVAHGKRATAQMTDCTGEQQ